MNRKLRLLFFSYSGADWTWPIEDSLLQLSKELDIEIFILSSRKNLSSKCILDLICLTKSLTFQKILNLNARRIEIPDGVLETQFEYESNFNRNKKINLESVKKCFTKWCVQAQIFYGIVEPDIIIFWNGEFGIGRAFRYIADKSKIPYCFAEKGVLPESWYLDKKGINAESEIAKSFKNYLLIDDKKKKIFQKKLEEIDKKGSSAWNQPQRKDIRKLKTSLGINQNQKVIFFPGQVDFDSNILLFSKYFKRSLDVLTWISNDLKDDRFFILAKPHPLGFDKKKDYDFILKNKGCSASDLNIVDAVYLSDIVVTINSTVGFEALTRGKPVLQLGYGILSGKNLVKEYSFKKSALDQIKSCIDEFQIHKNKIYDRVLKLGAFLDQNYYCYRYDNKSIFRILRASLQPVTAKEKKFLFEELRVFFIELTSKKRKIMRSIIVFFIRAKIVLIKIAKFLFPIIVEKLKRKLNRDQ